MNLAILLRRRRGWLANYDAATDTGYYGEVTAADLINGTDLAALIGLTAGTAQHSDYGWFKFFVGPRARCNRTAGIATGTITVSDTPVADETLTVGSTTLTFKASRSGAGEIAIDADTAVQAQNIMAAIREDVSGVRARQIVHTPAINNAAPVGADPNVVVVTANLAGVEGNTIVLTASATGIAVSGSGTLAGGVTGTSYTLFVAQRPYRHTVSWNHINTASAVTGNTTIAINNRNYKIRLLTGGDKEPATFTYGTACSDDPGENSEWNELLYRIHVAAPTCTNINIGMSSSADIRHGGPQRGDNWDTKTDADIVVTSGNGRWQWCQEVSGPETSRRVCRGDYGLAYFITYDASLAGTNRGWRPCLEVV